MATQREITLLTVCVLFLVVTPLFVLLRLRSRTLKRLHIQLEDWFLLAALLVNTALCITLIIAATAGNIGSHSETDSHGLPLVTQRHKIGFLCTDIAHPLVIVAEGLTKVSLLLLYRRIFEVGLFRIFDNIAIAIVVAWTISFTFAKIFECKDYPAFWDSPLGDQDPKAGCIDFPALYLGEAISDLLTDIMILLMPIPCIWNLQMPWRRRVGVTLIFLLGSFVLATNSIRISEFVQVIAGIHAAKNHPGKPPDESYLYAIPYIWSVVESTVGIICACLPTIAPLFDASIKGSIAYHWPRSLSLLSLVNRSQSMVGRTNVSKSHAGGSSMDYGESIESDRKWENMASKTTGTFKADEISLEGLEGRESGPQRVP